MAFIITSACIKDELCVEPTDCIHPKKDEPAFEEVQQLFVDPEECIDCGACVPVCTSDAIHDAQEVPEDLRPFVAANAAYYGR
jgi:TPP-dependent indolepyruvate ferredoxin oxidoreductase alpha subunit